MSIDPLGKSAGSISDLSPDALVNAYPTIADTPVDATTDRIIPRQVSSGTTRGIQQLGSENVYSDGGNQQIIVEDDIVPRVLMGKQATFGEGFYVSKANINVKTNTNASQFIFNSNQNMFKIVLSSTATVTTPNPMIASTNYSTSVAHNLGFVPAFMAFVTTPSSLSTYVPGAGSQIYNTPYNLPTSIGTYQANVTAQVRADAANIYFDVWNFQGSNVPNANGDWVFRFYLFQETAI